jgi:hypothetical protein
VGSASGLILLGALVAGTAYLVPDEVVRRPMWLFVYLALVACSVFSWKHAQAPKTPVGWLKVAGTFVFISLLLLCMGHFVAPMDHALYGPLSLITGNPRLLMYADFAMLGSYVALAGWARSLIALGANNS